MLALIRRLAIPVVVVSIIVNALMLIVSIVIWVWAASAGLLDSVTFVSNVSMLALVFAALSGVASAIAAMIALVPTDDLLEE